MKLHTCVLILVVAWGTSSTIAQTAPPPMIPAAIKTAPTPPVDVITTFVSAHIQQLVGSDPALQSASREALIQGAASPAGGPPPVNFLSAYTLLLTQGLQPHLKDPDFRVRLNIAIVLCRVAEKVEDPRLIPLIREEMNDPSEAVVLWAVKAAKYAMLAELRHAGAKLTVPADLNNVVAKHPTSGPIAAEAYEALNIPSSAPNVTPQMLATAAEEMCKLMGVRITQYKTTIPDEPGAEAAVATFVSSDHVWNVLNPTQQLLVVQSLCDLINVMAQQGAAGGPAATRRVLDPLETVAAALYVIGDHIKSPEVQAAAIQLTRRQVPANINGPQLIQRAGAISDAFKKAPAFSKLQPPPTIESAAAETAAATTEPAK